MQQISGCSSILMFLLSTEFMSFLVRHSSLLWQHTCTKFTLKYIKLIALCSRKGNTVVPNFFRGLRYLQHSLTISKILKNSVMPFFLIGKHVVSALQNFSFLVY
jgi:hypothetical protein